MRERFQTCNEVEKGILKSIKPLYYAGIYQERQIFAIDSIKEVCRKREEIEKKQYEGLALLNGLKNKGFIELTEKTVQVEETYFESVIEDDFAKLANLREMMGIFSNDPQTLVNIGNEATRIGEFDLERAEFESTFRARYPNQLQRNVEKL